MSAGKDKNAVKKDAKIADILLRKNVWAPKKGLIIYAII